ncbi:hypothetical protein AAVH_29883 [Aphelenchoides avenae]|nr:hypothetical protein AAVH_29883 [Aphelenchus avenae]
MDASNVQMITGKHEEVEKPRELSLKSFTALRKRYNAARNKLADADPDRIKRATCIIVVLLPVLDLIAFLVSYAAVYKTRVEQGGVYIKWSLNCSASSSEGTFLSWTLECSHEPIASLHADELIRGALELAKNRSFIDGQCTEVKKTIFSDVQSRHLGDFSAHCDLFDPYKSVQAEGNLLPLLAYWMWLLSGYSSIR